MQYYIHIEYGFANSSEGYEHSLGPVEEEWISDCNFFERVMRYLDDCGPAAFERMRPVESCRKTDKDGTVIVYYDWVAPPLERDSRREIEYRFTCTPDDGDDGHECIPVPLGARERGEMQRYLCPVCGAITRLC